MSRTMAGGNVFKKHVVMPVLLSFHTFVLAGCVSSRNIAQTSTFFFFFFSKHLQLSSASLSFFCLSTVSGDIVIWYLKLKFENWELASVLPASAL